MKHLLKDIIFLVGGAIVGFGGASVLYNKKINDIVNAETEKLSEYYDEIIEELNLKIDSLVINDDCDSDDKNIEKKEVKTKKKSNKKNNSEKDINYDEIIDNLNYNRYSYSTKNNTSKSKPYIITREEFEEINEYDKRMISYFPDDEICMDSESEEVIDGSNRIFGADNLINVIDKDEIYIRNEKLETDYKIILENGSYQHFIEESEWDE